MLANTLAGITIARYNIHARTPGCREKAAAVVLSTRSAQFPAKKSKNSG